MSKKQSVITLSTCKAEYISACQAAKQTVWYQRLLDQIGQSQNTPTTLYCDNQVAIALSHNLPFHAQSKHIDIQYHYIHEKVHNGTIELIYCPTSEMMADALTKALPKESHKHFTH